MHRINGEEVRFPRGAPTLTSDVIPTIFPNAPAYLSKRGTCRKKERRQRKEDPIPRKEHLFTPENPEAVDDNEAPAVITISAVREIQVPNKYWTTHELHNSEGVCFTSCLLNAVTGEVNVEKAVFFTLDDACGFHAKTFVLGKLPEI